MAMSTTSVILPPDISTLSAACVATVPRPSDSLASEPDSRVQLIPSETRKWSWFWGNPARVVRLTLRSCFASSWSWMLELTPSTKFSSVESAVTPRSSRLLTGPSPMASIWAWTSEVTLSRNCTFSADKDPSARSARSASYPWISTPISRPRFWRAVLLSEAPVPPSAIARSVIFATEPPVILTASEFWPAIVPTLSLLIKDCRVSDDT